MGFETVEDYVDAKVLMTAVESVAWKATAYMYFLSGFFVFVLTLCIYEFTQTASGFLRRALLFSGMFAAMGFTIVGISDVASGAFISFIDQVNPGQGEVLILVMSLVRHLFFTFAYISFGIFIALLAYCDSGQVFPYWLRLFGYVIAIVSVFLVRFFLPVFILDLLWCFVAAVIWLKVSTARDDLHIRTS